MFLRTNLALLAALAFAPGAPILSGETFFRVPLKELQLAGGALPNAPAARFFGRSDRDFSKLSNRVTLEGGGEGFLRFSSGGEPPDATGGGEPGSEVLVLRLPEAGDAKGKIHVPAEDGTGLVAFAFTIPAAEANPAARVDFYRAKSEAFSELARLSIPGAAWFRHQADVAARALERPGEAASSARPGAIGAGGRRPERPTGLEDTYEIFSGGRALSENLQLDRVLAPSGSEGPTVDVNTLEGITVAAIDWKPLVKDLKPAPDPLASWIPSDQHALFFPSFQAMVALLEDADAAGAPILELVEPRAEDARTRERYERQLCLGLTDFGRLLGPAVVASMAFTGSDPYLRVGSDVAVLFEARAPEVLRGFIEAKHAAVQKLDSAVKASQGEIDGVKYAGVVSPRREVSSYLAVQGATVIVTNSLAQLRRIVGVLKGKIPSLASSDEYTYFRDRYARGAPEETSFLILTDATIRRWCGPAWRIADSRRTRVAAVLADLQAQHLAEILKGRVQEGAVETPWGVPDAGAFRLTRQGPVSEAYGSLDFMTPIAELSIQRVTKEEASSYERFRSAYQLNWRRFFDPIAVRFTSSADRLGLDLSVMPLIEGSDYRWLTGLTGKARIAPGAGDPHESALLHVAMAIDTQSQTVQQFGSMASGFVPGLKANPLGWLGTSIALYADDDPIWNELRERRKEGSKLFEENFVKLPIALHCEVKDALGLAGFLAVLRGFVEQSAPGLTTWETSSYKDQPYVKVAASERAKSEGQVPEEAQNAAVYYAASGNALVVTLREDTLKGAIDRHVARKGKSKPASNGAAGDAATPASSEPGGAGASPASGVSAEKPAAPSWLGSSVAARANRKVIDVIEALARDEYRAFAQAKSWDNLWILNEWKRLFPAEDPVKVHERLWGTRLVCPGGGTYVWNESWQTMESTAYGSPLLPKAGPDVPLPISTLSAASFGLTFEPNGLRARTEIERKPASH